MDWGLELLMGLWKGGVRRLAAAGARGGLPLGRSALRCDCPAVLGLGVAPNNSLRSLRSLRSNTFGESDHEGREYARRPQALRSSASHRSPAPGTGRREAGDTNRGKLVNVQGKRRAEGTSA